MNSGPAARVRVWDLAVRISHWTVAALVIANWLNEGSSPIHRQLGTAALVVVGLRLLWGLIAKNHARLASFRPGIQAFFTYVAALRIRKPPRYLGHNPAAAWMVTLLWSLVILLGISGWMMRMDYFWGDEWLQGVHAVIGYALLAAVVIHIGGALWMSRLHDENLIAAMLHGDKPAPVTPASTEVEPH